MEDEIEEDQPQQVVGQSQFQQSLRGFVEVHRSEGHERVDHTGGDVLLHDGHDQVEAHHHLHRPPGQEHRPDPRGAGEVELVAEGRGQPEIVDIAWSTESDD